MLTTTSLDALYRDALNFPMAPKGMTASKRIKKQSKAKMVYWKTIHHSRGIRDIPEEATTSKGNTLPSQINRGIGSPMAILPETTLPSMDIDETLWTDEAVTDKPKTVSFPRCPSRVIFHKFLSPSASTWKSLFQRWTATCNASLITRAFQLQRCARVVCLPHSSGDARTASPFLYSARSVAKNPTNGYLSTGSQSGLGITSSHHGYRRLA